VAVRLVLYMRVRVCVWKIILKVNFEMDVACFEEGRISSSCSTSGTRRVNLGTKSVIIH
jgi:hypothetical protein